MNNKQLAIKWWKRDWFVILLFVLFTPLGLYWMWKHSTWKTSSKWLHTIFFGLPLLLFFLWWSRTLFTWVSQGPAGHKSLSEIATESEEPTEAFTSEWSSYTSNRLGFTIRHPTEWLFTEPAQSENNPYLMNRFYLTDPNLECNGNIELQVYSPNEQVSPVSLSDVSKTESVTTDSGIKGERSSGKADPSLLKSSSPPHNYTCNLLGEFLSQVVVFKTSNYTYVFEAHYPSKSKNTDVFIKSFDQVLKTFRINNT